MEGVLEPRWRFFFTSTDLKILIFALEGEHRYRMRESLANNAPPKSSEVEHTISHAQRSISYESTALKRTQDGLTSSPGNSAAYCCSLFTRVTLLLPLLGAS